MKIDNQKVILDLESKILNYFSAIESGHSKINNLLIDGFWGSGKTTIIEKVLSKISDQRFQKIKIDLWEFELFESDIVLLIVFKILKIIGIEDEEDFKFFEAIKESIKIISKDYFGTIIEQTLKISKKGQNELIDTWKKRKNFSNNFPEIKKLLNKLNSVEELIKNIDLLLNKKKQKIILVFDEIDRCNDENIFKILTAIKLVILNIKYKELFVICCANSNHIKNIGKDKNENYISKIFASTYSIKGKYKYDENFLGLKSNQLIDFFINNSDLEKDLSKRELIYIKENIENFKDLENVTEQFFYWVSFYYANYQKTKWELMKTNFQNIQDLNFNLQDVEEDQNNGSFIAENYDLVIKGSKIVSDLKNNSNNEFFYVIVKGNDENFWHVNFLYLLPFIAVQETKKIYNSFNSQKIQTKKTFDLNYIMIEDKILADFFWSDFFPIIKKYQNFFSNEKINFFKIILDIENNGFIKK